MKERSRWKVSLIVFLVAITFFSIGKVVAQGDLERKLETYLQVLDLVKNDYVGKNVDDQKLVYGSIRGMLDSLDDPYTRFLEPKAYKEMKTRMAGSYSGIGIYIGIKDKLLTVISPIDGTPAKTQGLRAGDKILKIEGKDTKDMAIEEAVSLIRGPQGSKVKLTIYRQGWKDTKDLDISRAKITIKSVVRKDLANNIAYIKLNTFENLSAAQEFEKALRESKDDAGLIIDVRGNGGGLLQNAIEIGSMFIPQGMIVQTIDREGRREQLDSTGRVLWQKPVVLLINEGSASASEILAGALRDNKVATLVGKHTFGKASVQNVRNLNDGSAVLLTVAKYLTPNGEDINKKGISPEVEVTIPTKEAEEALGTDIPDEAKDPQLQMAEQVLLEKYGVQLMAANSKELLDNELELKKIDPAGMLAVASQTPEMIVQAETIAAPVIIPKLAGIRQAVVLGMGGSAIAGDIAADLYWKKAKVPIITNRQYLLPGYVGPETLVFALSYSGETEETLNAVREAGERKAKVICVTSGGKLKEIADSKRYPLYLIPTGYQPRAALPFMLVPLLNGLEKTGLIPAVGGEIKEAASLLQKLREEYGVTKSARINPAKELAKKLVGKTPLIFGAAGTTGAVALRWKCQFNENSKQTALISLFPELNHNEIVNLAALKREDHNFALIVLRDEAEIERVKKRIEITKSLVCRQLGGTQEIAAQGKSPLARALSLIYFGDLVSVYLAILKNIDPTQVEAIVRLKKEMGR